MVNDVKQRDLRSSYDSGNAMCYYGHNGYKYPNGGCEGGGFSKGDIIEVDVNRATSTIKYSVNGTLKATQVHNMLADNNRVFMPYVEIPHTNDVVEWLLE